MDTITHLKERFGQGQAALPDNLMAPLRQEAFTAFNTLGLPGPRHEEWRYTRVANLFSKEYQSRPQSGIAFTAADWQTRHLPGHEQANEIVFLNGIYTPSLSCIRSPSLELNSLDEAASGPAGGLLAQYLGDSSSYLRDGIHALNTAFMEGGIFISVRKGCTVEHPVYVYNITDARATNVLAQPRSFLHLATNASIQVVETYLTFGQNQSFTNQVMEVIVETDARLEYYKIQDDGPENNQVSTTHIRQTGKSYTHTVTISLNGGLVRNNLNLVLDAPYCEAHLYGLYLQNGNSHVDNHTIVDNVKPNCLSNELYKGILNGQSTGVFNGKIFVRQPAQKTNAYQSNKNILLSEGASINTKPQLEIFADDVKCTHGCTVGRLNEEGLFYLQSRGIPENRARSLLMQSFAADILEHIRPAPIRSYVENLITQRLETETI